MKKTTTKAKLKLAALALLLAASMVAPEPCKAAESDNSTIVINVTVYVTHYDYAYKAQYDYQYGALYLQDSGFDEIKNVLSAIQGHASFASGFNASGMADPLWRTTFQLRTIVMSFAEYDFNPSSISHYQTYKVARPLAADAASTNTWHSSRIGAWVAGLNQTMKSVWKTWLENERREGRKRWENHPANTVAVVGPNVSAPRQDVSIGNLAAANRESIFQCLYGTNRGVFGTVSPNSTSVGTDITNAYCENVF